MAIEEFKFYPVDGFKNESSFPNPATEQDTREQMQRLHNQTRDKLNEVISGFNSLTFPTDEHIIELIKGYSPAGIGKVVASDINYAEVHMWADGNPSQDDRLNRFVTLGADGISIASSESATLGVSVQKDDVGFIGGYADGDENDSSKAIVSIMGTAKVKTSDNSIVANDYVMSDANGYAVKANYGYNVLRVVSSGLLEIIMAPNTDAVQRTKAGLQSVETDVESLRTEIQNAGSFYGIDETNILADNITNVNEYTATEDCYCSFRTNWGGDIARKINGVAIENCVKQQGVTIEAWLKSGQVFTLTESNGTVARFHVFKVFGLKK